MKPKEEIRTTTGITGKHILSKIFLEDWLLKLIALVITLALWLGVTGLSTPTTKRFTVPLNFSIANDAAITNTPIQEVDIVMSGDKRKIEQINRAELVATVDLSEVAAGDRVLSLTPENVFVPLPFGIKLDEIQPGRIAVRIEAVGEIDITVKAEIIGEPADGFEVYEEVITPPTIRIRGPVGFIRTRDSVQTDAIDITGAKADVLSRQVPVRISNNLSAVLNTVVDATIKIGEKRVEKTFYTSVSGKKITITLFGPKTVIEAIKAEDLHPQIIKAEDGADSPQLTLPDNLRENVQVRAIKIRS